jgi:uncharacterized protein YdeI (YjbR/CyaY-like superfamily)
MKTLYVTERNTWRNWLEENHAKEREIWLIFYKKSSRRPRIPYEDAVEEALCYGWIDSIVKKIDEQKFAQKFTPRKPNSNWSESNLRRVTRLIAEGKMAPAGLSKVDSARLKQSPQREPGKDPEIPAVFEQELKRHRKASGHFTEMAPSYRRQYIGWVSAAKKEETRRKRVREAIRLLSKNQKLGLK